MTVVSGTGVSAQTAEGIMAVSIARAQIILAMRLAWRFIGWFSSFDYKADVCTGNFRMWFYYHEI